VFLSVGSPVSQLTSDPRIYNKKGVLQAQPLQTVLPELDLAQQFVENRDKQEPTSTKRFQPDAIYRTAIQSGDNGTDNLSALVKAAPAADRASVIKQWAQRNPQSAAAAQKLVDAAVKAAGYITEGWHAGTVSNTFDIKAGEKTFRHESSALGAFFGSKDQAAEYGNPKRFYLQLDNPLKMTERQQSELDTTAKARLLRMQAIKAGHDSAMIGNEIVAFKPNQIKSADLVTLDDAGNIIPLSQRFNVESPDIRFQPDAASPSILNGSNGTRIIKSPSGKFRVYSVTGTLLGIRDTEQAAKKLATK
jgi:hypothetical protein